MAACLSLLRQFDPDNTTPQITIKNAGLALEDVILPSALADLNDGQFSALVDLVAWRGIDFVDHSLIKYWVNGGNLTLPSPALAALGDRGKAEQQLWLIGNSL